MIRVRRGYAFRNLPKQSSSKRRHPINMLQLAEQLYDRLDHSAFGSKHRLRALYIFRRLLLGHSILYLKHGAGPWKPGTTSSRISIVSRKRQEERL